MKCDLHVHTLHSGLCTVPGFRRFCRESYSKPQDVYDALKARGMDLVTLTDHDSIEGAERLRRYPDFFVSEEVTCRMPSGNLVHVGVYDLSERQHVEIQRRREDLPSLLAYLSEARLFYCVNHMFSALTGSRKIEDYWWFKEYFPAFETMNGAMLPLHNRQARRHADNWGKAGIGGSDAHVVASAGSCHTRVPAARDKAEFLAGLRAGRGMAEGEHGSYAKLTRDILGIVAGLLEEKPVTALLAPLVPLVPLATLAALLHEAGFAWHWARCVRREGSENLRSGPYHRTRGMEERFA